MGTTANGESALSKRAKPASEGRFPWERQDGESVQAYARFLAYRDTPPQERSIRKLGVSMQLAARWSRKWRWVARTVAYDAWLLELSDACANHAVLRHRSQLARFSSLSVEKASATVAKLNETKLTADEAIALAVNGAKLGRQALGLTDGETKAERAPAALVAVSFNSPWLQSKQNETERREVVLAGEKVLGEIPSGEPDAGRALGPPTITTAPRLAEKIVKCPRPRGKE